VNKPAAPLYYAMSEFVDPGKMFKVAGSKTINPWWPGYILIHPSMEFRIIGLALQYGFEPHCLNLRQPPKLINPYEVDDSL
jgi:hypothetical protein